MNCKVMFHTNPEDPYFGARPAQEEVDESISTQIDQLDGDLENALLVAPTGATEGQVQAALKKAMSA